jgi:hypothetical protein
MHVDHDAVRTDREGGAGEGHDQIAAPAECERSTITGRWDSRWANGTALTFSVLLVAISNVRMPRSHSTMSGSPRR